MKKTIIATLLMVMGCGLASAMPVGEKTARLVASNYLIMQGKTHASLTLADQLTGSITKTDDNLYPAIYVYNIGNEGFILVSGDDEVEPILGYSLNGVYDTSRLSCNFAGWLDAYRCDIAAIIHSHVSGQKSYHSDEAVQEWTALKNNDASFYNKKGTKDVSALVSTRWDQGAGYNNYCPAYSGGYGGHAYTGCVATSMAQIIRYWQYPSTGFGYSAYSHSVYGRLKVNHDSVVYDYANMPTTVSPYSPQAEQDAVSLLCYHCGVAVSMNYQHAGNTDGSGAHTEDVPAALYHFGYLDSKMIYMTSVGEETWKEMLRNEFDNNRPVLYRGYSTAGGHAFVCDGYRQSQNKFHFNFGWSGYQDGYYTLTNLNGYTTGQGGVINIQPSGLAPLQETYYVSENGTGDGSSWDNATSNLNGAMLLQNVEGAGNVWVKEGTYYGDTTGTVAFPLYPGISLYGGFVGNETALDQRITGHPSILDGSNARPLFSSTGGSKTINIDGFSLRHSRSNDIALGYTTSNVKFYNCEITENVAEEEGVILYLTNHNMEYCRIHHNEAPTSQIVQIEGGTLNYCRVENNTALAAVISKGGTIGSSLIAHNSGDGADATQGGTYVNSTIVSNNGRGIIASNSTKIRNTVIWNNDTAISGSDTNIFFSAIDDPSAIIEGNSNILLVSENSGASNAPHFTLPLTSRGLTDEDYSYRLLADSPLRDAADTNRSSIPRYDLDGLQRSRNGRVDIGCYEYMNVDIPSVNTPQQLSLYPNPASTTLHILGAEGPIELLDFRGSRIAQYPEGTTQINISSYPRGLYLIKTPTTIKKLIIK